MTDQSADASQNLWDERYARPEYVYGTEPNAFLASVVHHILPGPVLSLGEGEGRNAVFLAERGFEVTAVDASRVGLAKAERLAAERGVTIVAVPADLADYVITPGSWAGIVSVFCHLPPAVRRRLYGQVADGLRPGGVFVLEAYTPDQLGRGTGGPPTVELMVALEELRGHLAGLELEIAHEIERPVLEGTHHIGTGAVVQVVAAKPGGDRQ